MVWTHLMCPDAVFSPYVACQVLVQHSRYLHRHFGVLPSCDVHGHLGMGHGWPRVSPTPSRHHQVIHCHPHLLGQALNEQLVPLILQVCLNGGVQGLGERTAEDVASLVVIDGSANQLDACDAWSRRPSRTAQTASLLISLSIKLYRS